MYCDECGIRIEKANYYGDYLCEDCEEYCDRCGDYCYDESSEGMCLDCYEDWQEECREGEDY